MQANVVITSTNSQLKKLTTTLTYVNTEAANNKLATLAQAINALTTNSYVKATKEVKGEVL